MSQNKYSVDMALEHILVVRVPKEKATDLSVASKLAVETIVSTGSLYVNKDLKKLNESLELDDFIVSQLNSEEIKDDNDNILGYRVGLSAITTFYFGMKASDNNVSEKAEKLLKEHSTIKYKEDQGVKDDSISLENGLDIIIVESKHMYVTSSIELEEHSSEATYS